MCGLQSKILVPAQFLNPASRPASTILKLVTCGSLTQGYKTLPKRSLKFCTSEVKDTTSMSLLPHFTGEQFEHV
jgi:hypothetical protein